jgi:phage N-6-adenine-methyltransferase
MTDRRKEGRPDKDEWRTPISLVLALRRALKLVFTLDPCADPYHSLEDAGVRDFYTREDDGLTQSWGSRVAFVNPPFSQKDRWVDKAILEAKKGATVGVVLEAMTDGALFQKKCVPKAMIYLLSPRVRFVDPQIDDLADSPMRGHYFAVFTSTDWRFMRPRTIEVLDLRPFGYRGNSV